ncbi:DedA family protein [Xenorhabdus sp. BG5]|uniref:DedA family protein n=1 Tax=Xenorhabdus sp. BG5 TaxID=2782014 RepID=UPI00187F8A16|nr:DedA family protein [Xenorhabdus sp. BG5]MBE8596979.1 DedA family protein [Xenorhabdus sp. BG5]
MEIVTDLIYALWHQDYETLANPSLVWAIYILLFTILFLENGILPAAFLPGDSLLILVGVLIAKETMSFPVTLVILTTGASLGCWIGYLQGRWLGNTKLVQGWLSHLPAHYHQRAHNLFHRHGLSALLIGRFIAFIRTLLPTLAGLAGLKNGRFQIFNWLSGFMWVVILTTLGYALGKSPLFRQYEEYLMNFLVLLPVGLLLIGLIGSLTVIWRKKRANKSLS